MTQFTLRNNTKRNVAMLHQIHGPNKKLLCSERETTSTTVKSRTICLDQRLSNLMKLKKVTSKNRRQLQAFKFNKTQQPPIETLTNSIKTFGNTRILKLWGLGVKVCSVDADHNSKHFSSNSLNSIKDPVSQLQIFTRQNKARSKSAN